VLAEVVTGGASASDEYIEIANAGRSSADLGGCEVVYVTASGATTTRKAAFSTSMVLNSNEHLLIANSAGVFAELADATYSGGISADGGAVALRHIGGEVIDAVGWGTAANSYVEGTAAPAPPAKSSIERLPGGSGGNTRDTNDNAADWHLESSPVPQSLASTRAPAPTGTPTEPPATDGPTEPPATEAPTATSADAPTATATPTATPVETDAPTSIATATATPTATPAETEAPTAPATPHPTGTPTPTITPTRAATATPSPTRTPSPTATPLPQLTTIATARAGSIGAKVHIAGIVTAGPGVLGSDVLIAVQDETAGIFVRLAAASKDLPIGRAVELDGTLASPYGQLEIRNLGALIIGGDEWEPGAPRMDLAGIGESAEGSLVSVVGTVTSVTQEDGRITVAVGDGTNTVHVLADPAVGLAKTEVTRGDAVAAVGIVGQRASATGKLDGYRLWLRRRTDLLTTVPGQTAAPSSAHGTTAPGSTASATGDLAGALQTRGAAVDVEATVTATAGLLDLSGPTIVVDDGATAVAVILPASATTPPVGTRVHVTGKVGRWETGPTVLASAVVSLGQTQAVSPRTVTSALDASLEWRLIRVCGRVDRYVRAGARWRLDIAVGRDEVSILGEPAAAIDVTKSAVGRLVVATGIVRRSSSDASVLQLLPRAPDDLRLEPGTSALGVVDPAGAAASSVGDGTTVAGTGPVPIAALDSYLSRTVTVAGLVTDTTPAAATISDGTGSLRLTGEAAAEEIALLEPGDAIEATGVVSRDEEGLVMEPDPASLVSLPGGASTTAAVGAGSTSPMSGASPGTTSRAALGPISARQTSPRVPLPDGLAIAALLTAIVVLGLVCAGAFAVARRRRRQAPALNPALRR
jgi:hypothetical protein